MSGFRRGSRNSGDGSFWDNENEFEILGSREESQESVTLDNDIFGMLGSEQEAKTSRMEGGHEDPGQPLDGPSIEQFLSGAGGRSSSDSFGSYIDSEDDEAEWVHASRSIRHMKGKPEGGISSTSDEPVPTPQSNQLRAKASQTATRGFMEEYISEHQGKLVHDVMAKPGMLTSKVEYLQDSDGNRLVSGKTVLMISRVEPSASQQTRRTGMQVSPNAQSSQPSRVVHDIPKPSKLKPDFLKEFLEGNGPLTLRCKDIEAAVKFIEHLGKSADVQELIDKGKLKIDYNQAPFNKPGSKELIAGAIDKATGPNPQQSVQLDEENTPPPSNKKYRS